MSWDAFKDPIYSKWKHYWFSTHPSDIAEYSWQYLFTGGKEIRARLFCDLWVYLSPGIPVCSELAFAIECIHVASLILDDSPWMDNAATRREKSTLHITFSDKKAILICHDVMYMAYLIWTSNRPDHIDQMLWESIMVCKLQRLMMGQWYDLEKKGTLFELASLKTGVLFELVAETMARCVSLDAGFWSKWGNHLGVLFQWTDDWLDREEDIAQNNRNAFNESYDVTLSYYGQIWQKIAHGIGTEWFNTPFGIFMNTYFTKHFHIPMSTDYSLNDLSIPYPIIPFIAPLNSYQTKHIFQNINGKDMIKQILSVSNHLMMHRRKYERMYNDKYVTFKDSLWHMDESQWESECYKMQNEFIWID